MENQRIKDQNFRNALKNSTVKRLKEREADAKVARDLAIQEGRAQEKRASMRGAAARMLWATKNQLRLIRVFA